MTNILPISKFKITWSIGIPFCVAIIFLCVGQIGIYDYVFYGPVEFSPQLELSVVFIPVFLILAVIFSIARRFYLATAFALCVPIIAAAFSFPFGWSFWEILKTHQFLSQDHSACIAAAADLNGGKKLSICAQVKHQPTGMTEAFVYDSSDEILKSRDARSSQWNARISVLLPDMLYGYERDRHVTPLGDHFYFVDIES